MKVLSKLNFNKFKFNFTFKKILLLLICLFLLLFYGIYFETSTHLEKYNVLINDNNYKNWKGTKIAFISDLTLQNKSLSNIENTINKINANNPDFLIISGYFFDSNTQILTLENYNKIVNLLKDIKTPFGKFAFIDDLNKSVDTNTQINDILERSDFQLLKQDSRFIYKKQSSFPLKLLLVSKENDLITYDNNKDKCILLTSNNKAKTSIKYDNIFLALTYGNYGGIIGIPFIKNIISNLDYNWKNDVISKDTVYINSTGVGTPSNIDFRLFNPSKAYLIEIQIAS